AALRAVGGTVRLSERQGPYQVTVFTQPTPCRAGPVDISLLLQDAATGEVVPDARITVTMTPTSGTARPLMAAAVFGTATNKLLYEAAFSVPEPDLWRVEFSIDGRQGAGTMAFELEVLEPLSFGASSSLLWQGWLLVIVALFVVHQVLVRRGA